MSLPIFKDWNKAVEDTFKDDFDLKYVVKVKTSAPHGVSVTQTTDIVSKGGKTSLNGKVSAKWAHPSGFTLDKLELKSDGSVVTESSLTGVYPGLKLEFKGDDSFKGDLSATYKCSAASVTADVDLVEFSNIKASVFGKAGPVNLGGAVEYKFGDKSELKTADVAVTYPIENIFVGLKTANKFSRYDASVAVNTNKKYAVSGKVSFAPEKSAVSGAVAVAFNVCPETAVKVKVDSDGVAALSVKHSVGKTFSVVGATELDVRDPTAFRLGLTTTLG